MGKKVTIKGAVEVEEQDGSGLPPWSPEHYGDELPDGSPDWRARVQACVDEHGRVLFSRMYEIVLTSAAHHIVPRTAQIIEGRGRGTGVRLEADSPFVGGSERVYMFASDKSCADVVFRNFDVDFNIQGNHNCTLNAISVMAPRGLVENVEVRRMRAGGKFEAFVIRCVASDQNHDAIAWLNTRQADFATVRNCRFLDPQPNHEAVLSAGRENYPEITCAFSDRCLNNFGDIDVSDQQGSAPHLAHPNAYNWSEAVGNRLAGKGANTVVWQQQPDKHIQKNIVSFDNHVIR